ncbi:AAA family ATPase [Persephonella sp.]
MILKKLYLENFLAHTQTEIDFAEKGITVFIGENGAGKSSILEAISYALYGRSEKGNLADLIHWGRNEAKVELEFQNGDSVYKIERIISLKGKRAVSSGIIYKKEKGRFIHYYQKNISKETPKITGITPKTFYSSILIKQGDIERLLELKPKDRAKLFEEILDMTLYQIISDAAAEKRRALESEIKILSSHIPEINKIKEERELYLKEKDILEQKKKDILIEKEKIEKEIKKLKESYEKLHGEKEKILKLKHRLEILEEKKRNLEKSLREKESLLKDILEKEKEIKKLKPFIERYKIVEKLLEVFSQLEREKDKLKLLNEKLKEIKEKEKVIEDLNRLAQEYEEKENKLKELNERLREISKLKGELSTLEERVDILKKKLSDTMKNAVDIATELTNYKKIYRILQQNPLGINQLIRNNSEDIEKLEEELKDIVKKKAEIEIEGKELRKKKEKIDHLEGKCPTCERPLDNHSKEEILNEIEDRLKELREKYKLLKNKEEELSKRLQQEKIIKEKLQEFNEFFKKHKEAEGEILKINSKIFVLNNKLKNESSLEKDKNEIEKFLTENREKYLQFKEAKSYLSKVNVENIKKEINRLEKNIELYSEKLEGKNREELKKEYEILKEKSEKYISLKEAISKKDTLLKEIDTLKKDIDKTETEKESVGKDLENTLPVDNEIDKTKKLLDEQEGKLKSINDKLIEIDRELSVTEANLTLKEKELSEIEKTKKDIDIISEKAEKYRLVEKALGSDGIQKVIRDSALYELPKLTNQIFSSFGFDFQQIRFSEKFDISLLVPTVEKNDRYVDVDAISGGQRVALGLALRLAIGRFLSSKTELLILDEPTVHLDEQRRGELVNLLLELKKKNFVRQLIIVTHDTEIEDAADSIYYIEKGKVKILD